jgi:hypothetical protein
VARGESGQTSAEYAGALVVVSVIVAAIATSGVGTAIADGVERAVCRIVGGDCSEPAVQRLAADGPAIAGRDIAVLPFPGSLSVTCGYGETNEHACKPAGTGVSANGTITAERRRTSLNAEGCPQQTVSLTADLRVEAGQQTGPKAKPTGRLAAYAGHSSTYAITAAPDQIDAMEGRDRSLPNPLDPRTIERGEAVQMSEEYYEGVGLERDYRAMQVSLGYDQGRRVSAGATRVDGRTMRVYVGDEEFVRNALSFGAGGISVGFGQELADGKLRSVDIDIGTAEGWAAYQQFALSGRLPARGAKGTKDSSDAVTYKASQSASVEAEFGNLKVGGLLTDSEGDYKKTTSQDGSVKHELSIRHDEVGLAVEVEKDRRGIESRSYALNLEGVDPEVYANFQALNGGGDTRPPAGGNVRMEFSQYDLMGMRRQALEHIAFQMARAGVHPRPTVLEVADNLERNHGTIRYGPENAEITIDPVDQSLAVARNPEEVLARLYRLADGDPHHFLTGPMTEFINRTSFANGDDIGSARSRLPGSVGGPRCD